MIDLSGRAADLDAVLQRFAAADAPGVVAGLRTRDGRTWRGAAGLASVQSRTPNTPGTPMRVGSVTKMFTAAIVFQIAAEGRLDLDGSPRQDLPGLPRLYDEVTVRRMLNHTSGLWDHVSAHVTANGPCLYPIDSERAYADATRQTCLGFAPGERVSYSNAAYLVLGRLIEALDGAPLEDVLRRRLFDGLGMAETGLVRSDLLATPGLAESHVAAAGGRWMRGLFPLPLGAEGGAVSTVDDLLTWLGALGRSEAADAGVWERMDEPVILGDGRRSNVRHGVMRERWRAVDLVGHDGGVIGGAARAMRLPALGLDLAILINRNDIRLDAIGRALLDAAVGEGWPEPEPPAPEPLAGDYYAAGGGRLFRFTQSDGCAAVDVCGVTARLRRHPDGLAGESVETAATVFAPSEPGPRPSSVTISGVVFARVADAPPGMEAPVGRYVCPDLGADVEITEGEQGPALTLRGPHGNHRHALRPVTDGAWRAESLMGSPIAPLIEAERAGGRIQALLLSTQRLQQLRLVPA